MVHSIGSNKHIYFIKLKTALICKQICKQFCKASEPSEQVDSDHFKPVVCCCFSGFGRCWKNDDSLQTEAGRDCHHHTYYW